MRRALAVALMLLAAVAPGASRDDQADLFQGFLVAASASDIFAPEFTFRVSGWSSSWGNGKLLELADDGKAVKKGDVIARFDFGARDALAWIKERVQRAEADESQGRLTNDQAVDALAMDLRRKQIEARLAGLNIEKERAVSKQQAAIYHLAQQLAEFEADASSQRFKSREKSRDAERAYLSRAVAQTRDDLERYAFYEARFSLKAPHDGVVRHAFNPRERHKVKKGDGLNSGQKVMSVARDATLAVRFFVPEFQISRITEGARVTVVSVTSAEELPAVVKSIGYFPQELGFLLENEDLPNGREKAFDVRAELDAPPNNLPAGTEVRVRLSNK